MSHENPFTVKVSPNLARVIPSWMDRAQDQHTSEFGHPAVSHEGDLYFNSKNIRVLLMNADAAVGDLEPRRLKKQAIDVLKTAHQKIAAFGTRRLSLEMDIEELQDAEIGFYSRNS
jgi:hypothetical protein